MDQTTPVLGVAYSALEPEPPIDDFSDSIERMLLSRAIEIIKRIKKYTPIIFILFFMCHPLMDLKNIKLIFTFFFAILI